MGKYGTGNRLAARVLANALLLVLCAWVDPARAEGKIGCLFSEALCQDEIEWCYDDWIFGKCVPKFGTDQEDMEKFQLSEEQSHTLLNMLEELQGAGLGWNDVFVQCRMQVALFSMLNNKPMPLNMCASLVPDPKVLDPQSRSAFVRFIPPVSEGFADELYSPPDKKSTMDIDRIDSYPNGLSAAELLQIEAANERQADAAAEEAVESSRQQRLINQVKDIKNRIELRRMLAEYEAGRLPEPEYNNYNQEVENARVSDYTIDDLVPNQYNQPQRVHVPAYKRVGLKAEYETTNRFAPEVQKTSFREMSREYNIPKVVLDQAALTQAVEASNEIPIESMLLSVAGNEATNDLSPESGVYTEGGLVFVPDVDAKSQAARSHLLNNMLGFTRHERLDVKKPGPAISFKPQDSNDSTDQEPSNVLTPKIKKLVHSMNDHGSHSVETDFTYVKLKSPIDTWRDGPRIVAIIAKLLNMTNYFTFSRVDRHEITFRVLENPRKKTALDIAREINDPNTKMSLRRFHGLTVLETGIGDKTKAPLDDTLVLAEPQPDVTYILKYIVLGAGAAALIVIILAVLYVRRNDRKRDKLGGLQAGLTNVETNSKDYQDLCRTRMATKNPNGGGDAGRIASLSKENDKQQTSSRSSVSSWSEEPATNMDISTGHMVLSYMEDHLKNKGRLQREWEALCSYEADPSSREAALQFQCEPLNRTTAPLPYDHSRVVVNHLANTEGLDYINASTITDHDPRAPAYIAAQGPLPTTLAHFWQMVWEQGSVVIVMLCRLQEMGVISCARYWPEEGSEVYHIYEVHLVSEHIWCEDYLVRSFYLKNLRTSETRTVTQFHFLSWPEFGFPAQAKTLLEFRRKVNKSYRGRSCPVIVHSSNGAGRTGSYILLDLVLARMNKGAREIDIAATLEHLRDQRAGLVATPQQFECVLMAVAEEVHAILKALPANTQPEKRELDNDTVKELEQADKREGNAEGKNTDKE